MKPVHEYDQATDKMHKELPQTRGRLYARKVAFLDDLENLQNFVQRCVWQPAKVLEPAVRCVEELCPIGA